MSLIGSLLKLESRLKCTLCEGLVSNARTLNECGHRFCRRCVEDTIGTECICPTCNGHAIIKNLRPDPRHDTLVACVRKLKSLLSDVQTVDSNALYPSLPRNCTVDSCGSETQTPSALRRVSTRQVDGLLRDDDDELNVQSSNRSNSNASQQSQHDLADMDTQTPSILRRQHTSSSNAIEFPSMHKRASSQEAHSNTSHSLLKRTYSEEALPLLQRHHSEIFASRCRSPLLRDFDVPAQVELSRREAVYEESHVPFDDLYDKSQLSNDSQDMILTNPDDDAGYMFDDQASASSDMPLSYPEDDPFKRPETSDLPADEFPPSKRSLQKPSETIPKRQRTVKEMDQTVFKSSSSESSDIFQALEDSKDDLPHDELPQRHPPKKYTQELDADALLSDMNESELPDDEIPRTKRVQSSPKDLLAALFDSENELPDDELPDDELPVKRKDTPPPPPPSKVISKPVPKESPLPVEQWKCPHCYFMNTHAFKSCNLCKEIRGTTPHTLIPLSVPQYAPSFMESIVPTSQWQQDQYASLGTAPLQSAQIMFTGVDPDKTNELNALVQTSSLTMLVNEVVDLPKHVDEVTHIVTHRNENGLAGRTVKYLWGILAGVWIVDVQWLIDCCEKKRWLPEEPFEILGDTVTGATHGPRRGRMRKGNQKPLFNGIKFNFFDKAHPNRDKLMKLCQVGGGDVVRRRPPADKSGAWRDHDVERSKINPDYPVIIVTGKDQLKKKSAQGLELYQVRESKWLLDCISKCQCPRL